jgi:hypothetical protein
VAPRRGEDVGERHPTTRLVVAAVQATTTDPSDADWPLDDPERKPRGAAERNGRRQPRTRGSRSGRSTTLNASTAICTRPCAPVSEEAHHHVSGGLPPLTEQDHRDGLRAGSVGTRGHGNQGNRAQRPNERTTQPIGIGGDPAKAGSRT